MMLEGANDFVYTVLNKYKFIFFTWNIMRTKRLIYMALLVFMSIYISSCSSRHESELTRGNAMQTFMEMSPQVGASFYAENRMKYDFLDAFYRDSIFPAVVGGCSYYELKSIANSLKSTPLKDEIDAYYHQARAIYLQEIKSEIAEYSELQKQLFTSEVLPLMKIELDSMLTADMENLIDKYAGGFLNYRKLEFFLGKDSKEFKTLWKENIHVQVYEEHMIKYVRSYLDSICEFQRLYFHDVTNRNVTRTLKIEVPTISIDISADILKQVEDFTSNETMSMTTTFVKDYVAPVAVGALTGGFGTLLYEIGNATYDVHEIYDEIKNQEVEPEQQLLSVCTESISSNIEDTVLSRYEQQILQAIDRSNKVLFDLIEMAL